MKGSAMSQEVKDYKSLLEISKKAKTLSGIDMILGWDQETYMPSGAAPARASQIELMANLIHTEKTSKPFAKALAKLIDIKTGALIAKKLPQPQQAALREWRKEYIKLNALPTSFVQAFAKLTSESMNVWADAKKNNTFKTFAPYLEKIVDMSRQRAEYFGYSDHPYDALIDDFEPNMTKKELTPLFSHLQKNLSELLKRITKAKQVDDSFTNGDVPAQKQLEFSWTILNAMGFDKKYGSLDLSSHPFSTASHPTDSRITTRIHPTSLVSNIMVILHEAGHGLYEMGLPAEHYGSPLCEAISLGIHESQSRLWETRIGQSKPFWEYFLPLMKKAYNGNLAKVSLDAFYRAINKVEPSFIRVEADEVTYPLHVIIRFEIESALIEGSLKVKDLPEAWNAKMKQYLGIAPKTDREGCLQDIHWSMGAIGYFPTYTLGTLYSSQFFTAFEKKFTNWKERVAKGDLLFIREWLGKEVHQHGQRYSAEELSKQITKKKLTPEPFLSYLETKYSDIYKL